jgi:tetratricopeptide (TPR) repeat protein
LGNLYFDSGNYQGAIRSYRKYLELDPDNADVLTDLGVMYRRNGQPDQAVASFDRAIAVDPQHQQSRYNKGVVLMQDLGQADTAVDVWRELLTINPEFRAPSGQRLSDMLAAMRKENSPLT